MKWEDKQVLFEARIKLTTDDLKAADEVDWIAVYDGSSQQGYYLPISTVGDQPQIVLRITPAKNGQTKGVRWAKDFQNF